MKSANHVDESLPDFLRGEIGQNPSPLPLSASGETTPPRTYQDVPVLTGKAVPWRIEAYFDLSSTWEMQT
ncbi:MAG: hypothetical protein ABSH14_15245, partial [Verrucomicrobiia bacterium]